SATKVCFVHKSQISLKGNISNANFNSRSSQMAKFLCQKFFHPKKGFAHHFKILYHNIKIDFLQKYSILAGRNDKYEKRKGELVRFVVQHGILSFAIQR